MKVDYRYLLLNGGILAFIALGVLNLIDHAFREDVIPPCNERYTSYIRFPENVGFRDKITDNDIELHLDQEIQGMSDFTRVIHPAIDALPVAFETRLPRGSINPRRADANMGGMGFSWRPEISTGANSACLTYDIWLPKDFKFAKGGRLPGLFGGAEPGVDGYTNSNHGFATHVLWKERGFPLVRAFTSKMPAGNGSRSRLGTEILPTGRWIKISQEVILNSPGQNNGTMRVWIDGELKHEASDVLFRKTAGTHISGVLSDVYYDGDRNSFASPKDTFIRITPFVLNWK